MSIWSVNTVVLHCGKKKCNSTDVRLQKTVCILEYYLYTVQNRYRCIKSTFCKSTESCHFTKRYIKIT